MREFQRSGYIGDRCYRTVVAESVGCCFNSICLDLADSQRSAGGCDSCDYRAQSPLVE